MNFLLHTWYQDVDDIVFDTLEHALVVSVELVMLGRHHDGVDALGDALVTILDSHLTLCVRSQVCHLFSFLTDLRKGAHQQMGKVERHRHQTLRLVRGIAEHHALVTCSLVLVFLTVNTPVDILALLMDSRQDTAAGNRLEVDIHLTTHFTHDDHLSCCHKRLASDTGMFVIGEKLIKDSITDLVGNLVRMPF